MPSPWILLLSLLCGILLTPFSFNVELLSLAPKSATSWPQTGHILLLTAHPDDESMFFAPTILGLANSHTTASRNSPTLFSLCLSVGNADGLGDVRKQELERSLDVLGIGAGRRWIVDRPDLQDNITASWDPRTVADVVRPYVFGQNITTILTFDADGISSHPNHVSLLHGASHLITSWSSPSAAARPAPQLYALTTVPLATKYTGVLGALAVHLRLRALALIQLLSTYGEARERTSGAPAFVSGVREYRAALRAMQQHRSQLVWFRWLYVIFSRYMWANEWVAIAPAPHAPTEV
ncbi:hypothetical protein CERSUDRAFT_116200 [Gelatoporia subvermispora B]|uniref:N-acetylglucosaminylphosphatidylinositol deacetylase n=1 Tax=Ceriporiopsis subvermispora (strain B) TaxID=914234 RepID=M2RAJ2_CERS8|nr:hypothetical protein CERSUDRAFT_116200 [Gelatoporia subvermispora B]